MYNTLKNIKNGETMMAEDTLVEMLLEAAAGAVADERDVALARAAARWASDIGGWHVHPAGGFILDRNGLCFRVLGNRIEQTLELQVRILDAPPYRTHARHRIAHLGHGLDVLAGEGLIPARFCTLGRRALEDHAEVLDRAALRLAGDPGLIERACALAEAADSARRFAGAQLAVTG